MMIYFDNAATTKPLKAAVDAAVNAMSCAFGNPSSLHQAGQDAAKLLKGCRGVVGEAVGCKPENITFTSGGSESINTALFAAAFKNKHLGRHIVSTAVEHEATLESLKELARQGFEMTLVPPERDGSVDAAKLINAMRDDTILLSCMAVNNETGACLPYGEAAQMLKQRNPKALVHVDAVQAFLKVPLSLKQVDLLSLSAHKIGGVKGCGALYTAPGLKLRPLIYGGGQENGLRSGTEGLPQIAAFAAACKEGLPKLEENAAHYQALKARLCRTLPQKGLDFALNSPEESSAHIANFSLCRGRSEVYIRVLSDRGICVSGGSACSKGKRSHVLAAMKLPANNIDAALRVSFCPNNTAEQIDALCDALADAYQLF